MTRVFDAPRSLVFEAWTKAEYLSRWFTPAPFTTHDCELDFRPGGVFRLTMRTPDGVESPMDARFTEIVPDERIVFAATVHGDLKIHDDGEPRGERRQDDARPSIRSTRTSPTPRAAPTRAGP